MQDESMSSHLVLNSIFYFYYIKKYCQQQKCNINIFAEKVSKLTIFSHQIILWKADDKIWLQNRLRFYCQKSNQSWYMVKDEFRQVFNRWNKLSTRIYFSCLYKLLLFGLLTVTHCLFTLFSNLDFYTFLTIFWTFYTFLKLLHVTSCNDFS